MPQLRMKAPVDHIINYFNKLPSAVFKRSYIKEILSENRELWGVSNSVTINKFIEFLLKETKLELFRFEFPYRNIIRYAWGKVQFYELVSSLATDSYFTHYSAMFFHELTEQIPHTIYLNSEQAPKKFESRALEQSRIDAAFRNSVRVSKNVGSYDSQKICLLNGMYTGQLGVIDMEGPEGEKILVTNVERTLIDIAVRPIYSGGVFEVQKAYRLASGKFSVDRLSAMLKEINYIYPYHQVIGFYLENAGVYNETSIKLLKKPGLDYDFYLSHRMTDAVFSKEWRVYYPRGL